MSDFFEIKSLRDTENKVSETSQKKRTSDYMTKYEYARLIASRAVEIENGFVPKISADGIYNPYTIATMELHARVIPLVIIRTLEDGSRETWSIKDMHIRDY